MGWGHLLFPASCVVSFWIGSKSYADSLGEKKFSFSDLVRDYNVGQVACAGTLVRFVCLVAAESLQGKYALEKLSDAYIKSTEVQFHLSSAPTPATVATAPTAAGATAATPSAPSTPKPVKRSEPFSPSKFPGESEELDSTDGGANGAVEAKDSHDPGDSSTAAISTPATTNNGSGPASPRCDPVASASSTPIPKIYLTPQHQRRGSLPNLPVTPHNPALLPTAETRAPSSPRQRLVAEASENPILALLPHLAAPAVVSQKSLVFLGLINLMTAYVVPDAAVYMASWSIGWQGGDIVYKFVDKLFHN